MTAIARQELTGPFRLVSVLLDVSKPMISARLDQGFPFQDTIHRALGNVHAAGINQCAITVGRTVPVRLWPLPVSLPCPRITLSQAASLMSH